MNGHFNDFIERKRTKYSPMVFRFFIDATLFQHGMNLKSGHFHQKSCFNEMELNKSLCAWNTKIVHRLKNEQIFWWLQNFLFSTYRPKHGLSITTFVCNFSMITSVFHLIHWNWNFYNFSEFPTFPTWFFLSSLN